MRNIEAYRVKIDFLNLEVLDLAIAKCHKVVIFSILFFRVTPDDVTIQLQLCIIAALEVKP